MAAPASFLRLRIRVSGKRGRAYAIFYSSANSLVSNPPTNSSPYRALCQLALALVGAAMAARMGQLAFTAAPRASSANQVRACATTISLTNGSHDRLAHPSAVEADAELAELYTSCPLAAVIDLQTV